MSKNYITRHRGDVYNTSSGILHIKEEPVTLIEEDFGDHYNLDYPLEIKKDAMRESLSMNDITTFKEEFTAYNDDVHSRHTKHNGLQGMSKTKFISTAEAIYHYQRDTPDRFHTSKKQVMFRAQTKTGRPGLTVPQSPFLRCKARSRPHHILSQKEKEEIEFEEIKNYKIKANPIPKCVIEGSKIIPEVPIKPITIPEPFKLTEIPKKIIQPNSSEEVYNFKARPAPKHILEKPLTKPVSPKVNNKRGNCKNHHKQDNDKHNQPSTSKKIEKLEKTQPEPFSFNKRDEELKKRREEKIKKQIENERRLATQFKAQPLPAAIKKRMQTAIASHTSDASSENKENQNHIKFEAKPPVVLYKEPFMPSLPPAQHIKQLPFDLSTTKRAAEREIFDRQLKEKEEENDRLRQQQEREQRQVKEKEIAQLRANMVHHAKPVPPLHPFIPEKSHAPITVPETPTFIRRMNQK